MGEALASPADAVIRRYVLHRRLACDAFLRAVPQQLGVVVPRHLLVHVVRMHVLKTGGGQTFFPGRSRWRGALRA